MGLVEKLLRQIRHNPGLGMLSQVMQTRAMTVAGATQTDLPGQRIKHSTNVRAIQPVAGAGDEQMRGNWSLVTPKVYGERTADVVGLGFVHDEKEELSCAGYARAAGNIKDTRHS